MEAPIEKLLNEIEWTPLTWETTPVDTPYATHLGELNVLGITVKIAQLNDGRRIIFKESLEKLLGCSL